MTNRYLDLARTSSAQRFDDLRSRLSAAEELINKRACVYATGSFGRLEGGPHSDLDLFIVVETEADDKRGVTTKKRCLDGIDEVKLKYHLITAVEQLGIAKFDGGGRYLESHCVEDFVDALGSREDDYQNTLTGRLLLLLESRPLLCQSVYDKLLSQVIDAYFVDFQENKQKFAPAFLINDILRLWRTFCVNYEFNRKRGSSDSQIKNLKLKYSRMLTCYSAIMQLLSTHISTGTVSPQDVTAMVKSTPTERLERLRDANALTEGGEHKRFVGLLDNVLDDYSHFLELTHKPKKELLIDYADHADEWKAASYRFGKQFAEALAILGAPKGSFDGLYRMILI